MSNNKATLRCRENLDARMEGKTGQVTLKTMTEVMAARRWSAGASIPTRFMRGVKRSFVPKSASMARVEEKACGAKVSIFAARLPRKTRRADERRRAEHAGQRFLARFVGRGHVEQSQQGGCQVECCEVCRADPGECAEQAHEAEEYG